MQKKLVTKKVKPTKIVNTRIGNKKQRPGNIITSIVKPALENIKKDTINNMSDCLTTLYN